MPKRRIINTKVVKIKPNLVKIRAYKKSVMIARTALPHFKPFHKSINSSFASLFPKMLLVMRITGARRGKSSHP
jgi:hypothetical protein